jgi:hypothetical protein
MRRLLLILSIFSTLILAAPALPALAAPATTAAPTTSVNDNFKNRACEGVLTGTSATTCEDSGLKELFEKVLSILSYGIGAVAVLMIIIGGLRYVLSGGDPNSTKGAKDTIMYAVIGLIVALVARVLVFFVANAL